MSSLFAFCLGALKFEIHRGIRTGYGAYGSTDSQNRANMASRLPTRKRIFSDSFDFFPSF